MSQASRIALLSSMYNAPPAAEELPVATHASNEHLFSDRLLWPRQHIAPPNDDPRHEHEPRQHNASIGKGCPGAARGYIATHLVKVHLLIVAPLLCNIKMPPPWV
jgi:hypothetical protein